jgi:NAD(P)-dependent dehydrogenase (short-subunit alcohol dehydrogenase family)
MKGTTMALLKGKTAVITGGTTGIGLATAKRFVEEGAHVFITGRRQAELDAAVNELGDNATGIQGDVSKAEDLDRLYAAVADSGRRLDVVFANAAVVDVARIGDITEEHLDSQLDVDFKGVVFTVQKALPLLNDGGSIILNSSNTNAKGSDGIGVYAAIKAALRSFARTWASELRDRKIRVNVVSPGATETPGINTLAGMLLPGPNAAQQFEEYQISTVPLARYGTSEEVANAVLFLASDLSSFTTGADIPVDGGVNQIY